MTGLTGSAGTAVVLKNGKAAIATDDRYCIQAAQQVYCGWEIICPGARNDIVDFIKPVMKLI